MFPPQFERRRGGDEAFLEGGPGFQDRGGIDLLHRVLIF